MLFCISTSFHRGLWILLNWRGKYWWDCILFICFYMCVQLNISVQVHMKARGQQLQMTSSGIRPPTSFETESEPGAHQVGQARWPVGVRHLTFSVSLVLGLQMCDTQHFLLTFWDLTWVLSLARHICLSVCLSCHLSPDGIVFNVVLNWNLNEYR